MEINKLYRYDVENWDGTTLHGQDFKIVRHTPKGFWIDVWGKEKWVNNYSNKRYAYPTKKEALESLIKRRTRYISILKARLKQSEEGIELAKDKLENPDSTRKSYQKLLTRGDLLCRDLS